MNEYQKTEHLKLRELHKILENSKTIQLQKNWTPHTWNTWLFIFILLFLDFCLIFGCCASARIYGDLYVRMCADLHASVRACFHVVVCYAAFMLNICVMALVICCGMLLRLHSECWGHQRTHSWWIVLALRSLFQIREHLKFIFFFLIVFFFIRFGKVVNPIP